MALSISAAARCMCCRHCRAQRSGRQALLVAAAATRAPPAAFSIPGLPMRIDLRELTAEAGSAEVLTDLRDVKVRTAPWTCSQSAMRAGAGRLQPPLHTCAAQTARCARRNSLRRC